MPLTLDNLEARPVAGVFGLLLLDLGAQALADALRNGGAVNLLCDHGEARTGELPRAMGRLDNSI